jgi:putative glutamine amidotransferase
MPRPQPLVAITASTEVVAGRPRVRVNQVYTDALERAGAMPVIVPPLDPARAEALIDRVDGLVFTGGEDVDARLYGQTPHPKAEPPHAARDRWEIALARAARDRRTPTLAICRGIQVVNVAFGGSLIQDIASQHPSALVHTRSDERTTRVHDVTIEAGTRLARAVGRDRITANSMHHQAVGRPGDGVRCVARADDGIVEGVEWADDGWWMLGVQWHPEELDRTPESWDRTLFGAFVEAVSSASARASRPSPGA